MSNLIGQNQIHPHIQFEKNRKQINNATFSINSPKFYTKWHASPRNNATRLRSETNGDGKLATTDRHGDPDAAVSVGDNQKQRLKWSFSWRCAYWRSTVGNEKGNDRMRMEVAVHKAIAGNGEDEKLLPASGWSAGGGRPAEIC